MSRQFEEDASWSPEQVRTSSLNKFTPQLAHLCRRSMPMQPTFPTPSQVTQAQPIVDTLYLQKQQ